MKEIDFLPEWHKEGRRRRLHMRQRRGVGGAQPQRAAHRKQQEGDGKTQRHAGRHLRCQRGQRLLAQFDPALQADGQQQERQKRQRREY